jgi:hypothetical protein
MKNKYPIKWVDQWGIKNSVTTERATEVLKEFYDAWPCGLEEVEASIQGHKRVIQRLKDELLNWHYSKEDIDAVITGKFE